MFVTRKQNCETLDIHFGQLKDKPCHNPCFALQTEEAKDLLPLACLDVAKSINSFGLCSTLPKAFLIDKKVLVTD